MTFKTDEESKHNYRDSIKIVIQTLIVLLLGWSGSTLTQTQKDILVVQTQLVDIKATLSELPRVKEQVIVLQGQVSTLQEQSKDLKTKVDYLQSREYK